jgi:hypothetical protein
MELLDIRALDARHCRCGQKNMPTLVSATVKRASRSGSSTAGRCPAFSPSRPMGEDIYGQDPGQYARPPSGADCGVGGLRFGAASAWSLAVRASTIISRMSRLRVLYLPFVNSTR